MKNTGPESWIAGIDRLVVDRRRLSMGLAVVLAVLSLVGVWKNGIRADFSPQALFTTWVDQQAIDEAFSSTFGKTENVALVTIQADDVTRPEVLQYVLTVARAIEQVELVDRVESIATSSLPRSGGEGEIRVDPPIRGDTVEPEEADELRRGLETSRLWEGRLLSRSRNTAVVAAFLERDASKIAVLQPVMRAIDQVVASTPLPPGTTAEIAGVPHIRDYVVERMLGDQMTLLPLAVIACALLLGFTFRWLPGMVLPNLVVAVCGLVLVGTMAWVAEPFNIINQMIPTLLVVIGVNDAIHIVSRYGEEYAITQNRFEAARRTVRSMAVACFLTSFTTAVGFGTLAISHTTILQRFGISAALAMLMAYVVTMLLLPGLLILAGKPSRRVMDHRSAWIDVGVQRIVSFSAGRPRLGLGVSLVVLALGVTAASQVTIDTTLLETFPKGTEIHRQIKLLERELDGVLPMEVHLTCERENCFRDPALLNQIDEITRWARTVDWIVLSATSYPDVLREAWVAYSGDPTVRDAPFRSEAQVAQLASLLEGGNPDPLKPWATRNLRELRINIQVADVGSRRAMVMADDLRRRLDAFEASHPGIRAAMTGDAYSGARGLDSLIRDMMSSLGTAALIIFVFLAILLRSVRLGLISVLPNITPLILTLAYMTVMGIHLNTTTVIIFSVSLGLAVDDTIHLLTRFREEVASGNTVDEAIRLSGKGAGRAVVITSVMLIGGLSVMYLSSFTPIRLFAELTAVTIASCIVGDLYLLPALLKLFWPERSAAAPAEPVVES